MIHKFVMYPNLQVRDVKNGKPSAEHKIMKLIEAGEAVVYRHKVTGRDLLPKLMIRLNDRLEGPSEPLYTDKIRRCNHCGAETVNYFKCSDCWKLIEQGDI